MEVEKVQNIALKTDNIPKEFIRSENEQPSKTTVNGSILEVPTIDLGDSNEENLVELISKASEEWGLFQVVNHGIPTHVIENMQRVGKEFFELPQEEKESFAKSKPVGYKGIEGYSNKLGDKVDVVRNWVDHLFHIVWPPSSVNYQFWPNKPPNYREATEEYTKYLRDVNEKLMKYWSKGLGLEEDKIKEAGGGEEVVHLAKINYYPPCPCPDVALGVSAHTDLSLLTILVPNDVPGLQVCRDGLWYNVRYILNALIIHIGDQLEVLSNGKYKAVLHRTTVNKEKTRISWPVFIEPPPEHLVGPIPELINKENPAKYKTKKFADYKYCKLNKLPQ